MAATRFELDPDRSQVSIDGSSSLHPIRARAAGLEGWVTVSLVASGVAARPSVAGEVRLALDRLASGNPVVDAETRRRIDVRHHPELVGTVTGGRRLAPDRLALDGEIAFRGEVQAVSGELVVERDGDDLRLSGEQTFDVRSWGLQPPRLGLLRVHPEVTVRLEAVAVPVGA